LSVDLDPALYEALKTLSQGDADHPPTSIGSQIRWILRNWFLKVKGIEIPLPPVLSAGRPKGIHTPKKKVAPPQAFVVQSESKLPQPVQSFRRVAKSIHIGKAAAETDKTIRVPNAAYKSDPEDTEGK
jgi:hypothetical protein